jgi:type I restriction enzyme, S subunit
VTRASLSQDLLKKLPVLLPPLNEQEEIGIFLDKEINGIDLTVAKIQKEIELLKEYRTALISEVVTGKIKVV